jgi:hypothetical protein
VEVEVCKLRTLVVETSMAIEGPMPSKLRLEVSVMFVPLFLGSFIRTPDPFAETGLNVIWQTGSQ